MGVVLLRTLSENFIHGGGIPVLVPLFTDLDLNEEGYSYILM